ncbi:MAG TPA: hypothetical protein PKY73_07705 [Hyphomonas sp.]|nr:hypothetical protein [Hyphomonas sp.]
MSAEDPQDKPDPAAAAIAEVIIRTLKAKLRIAVVLMALALVTFVWFAADAGRPVWLVTLIGFFGVILIGMFIALVAFWLHVFRNASRRNAGNAPDRPPSAPTGQR